MLIFYCLPIFSLLLHTTHAFTTASPVWLTSEYFRAGNEYVISTLTGNDQTPRFTFTYSSPLPGIPYLAYGLKNYRGNDYFGVEQFEIRREGLTAATFSVAVQIYGSTYIWMLGVPYLAIDPTFPHRLNSFDGVPLNYSNGNLVNVTDKNPSTKLYYSNTINYTQQAGASSYRTFVEPISNHRILLFMMALNIWSTNEGGSSTWYPIDFVIGAQILTVDTYKISLTLSYNTKISLCSFSMIMFDSKDVESSEKYFIMTDRIDYPTEGGFFEFPQEFTDNFFMGFIDFSTPRGQSVLHYNWEFGHVNGVYGVIVDESLPNDWPRLGVYALSRQGTMIFYMKTWQCPPNYDYFNLTTNLCQDMCGGYYFENTAILQCGTCSYSCLDCGSPNDCLVCNQEADHRYITNDKSCECLPGYYEDGENYACGKCGDLITGCLDCFYNTSFVVGDAARGSLQYGCFECEDGYLFIALSCQLPVVCGVGTAANTATNVCQNCPTECSACSTPSICTACASNFFLDSPACVPCSLPACALCSSLTTCSSCQTGFMLVSGRCVCSGSQFFDPYSVSCQDCSVTCITCSGPSSFECLTCNQTQKRILIGGACACDPYNYQQPPNSSSVCIKINENMCDRGFIHIAQTDTCVELCGDGTLLVLACDDGNIVNGDGCSDQCKIEPDFVCDTLGYNTPSVCRLDTVVELGNTVINKVAGKNELVFAIEISPRSNVYNDFNLSEILHFRGGLLDISQAYYDEETGQLMITAGYSADIEGMQVQLEVKSNHFFNPDYPDSPSQNLLNTPKATWSMSDQPIVIHCANNLQANQYPQKDYQVAEQTGQAGLAFGIMGCLIAFAALFLRNSIAVMMNITAIQLAYMGLVSLDGLHPISYALASSMSPITGFNRPEFSQANELTQNRRASSLGYDEVFLNNFNVMMMIQLGFLAITGFLYLASHRKANIKTGFKIMQRELLLIVIFNMPNVMFSIGLVLEPTFTNIVFGSVAMGMIAVQAVYVVKKGEDYFGFKETFDLSEKGHYKKVMTTFFLSRIGACFCLAFVVKNPIHGLIGSAVFEGAFCIMMFYGRPFVSFSNNILIMISEMLSIVFFALTYASKSLQQPNYRESCVKAMSFTIGTMVVIAVGSLAYSIYYDCINKGKKAKVYNELQLAKQQVHSEGLV